MPNSATSGGPRRHLLWLAVAGIVALAAALILHALDAADVCGFNEAVEGVFVQRMVEHGELLFPLANGLAPLYKPPLFHWSAVAIDRLAGISHVTAFNLRLPAALYGIAGIAITMLFASDLLGPAGAFLSGLILCASYQYIENARVGRVDMTLCFFETLALFAFALWQRQVGGESDPTSRVSTIFHYLFAAALGLATLAKGPIGALLPAGACALFLLIEKRSDDLRRLAAPGPLLLAILIGSSWYAACYLTAREAFLHRQLGSENLGRFFGALGAMAPWYYLKPLLLNSAPLSLLVPVAVYFALRSDSPAFDLGDQHSRGHQSTSDCDAAAVRLFAIFWLLSVIFFSIAAYKRRAYLLPLWPVSAVMLAWWIGTLGQPLAARRDFTLPRLFLVLICGGSIVFNWFYLPRKQIRDCAGDSMRTAAAEINRIVGRDEPLHGYALGDNPATLLFYLDRDLPPLQLKLGDAPPGYVLTTAAAWRANQQDALDLVPVFESAAGRPRLVLLRHGPALASFPRPRSTDPAAGLRTAGFCLE